MRLRDLLLEAPRDELVLQQIARAILKYIVDFVASNAGHDAPVIPKGKLGKILPKGIWGHLYNTFAHTDLRVILEVNPYSSVSSSPTDGRYYPTINALNIYGVVDGKGLLYNQDAILSNITHELRHRLDDVRSKGRMFKSKKEQTEYLKQPSEINARFSQAMADIVGKLRESFDSGSVMSVQEFIKEFEVVSVKYHLMDVFEYDPDGATQSFLYFATKGIFGHPTPPDQVHSMSQDAFKVPSDQPIGPMNDKQYRRLISRVTLIYNTAIDAWTKANKK